MCRVSRADSERLFDRGRQSRWDSRISARYDEPLGGVGVRFGRAIGKVGDIKKGLFLAMDILIYPQFTIVVVFNTGIYLYDGIPVNRALRF